MQEKNKMAGPDFITSIILIISGIVVFVAARQMKVFRTLIVSPGLFPMILGGVLVFFGVVILVMSIKRGGWAEAKHILSGEYLAAVWHSPRFRRGMIVFGLILVYVLLFGNEYLAELNFHFNLGGSIIPVNIGFLITTAGYLYLTFNYLKAMRRGYAIVLSLAAALVIYYAFNKGFGIPIP